MVKERFYARYKDYYPIEQDYENNKIKEKFYYQYNNPIINSITNSQKREYLSLGLTIFLILLLLLIIVIKWCSSKL